MKAPDKVYVYCDYEGRPDKVDIYKLGNRSVEYIRKDALLEKLENAAALYKKRSDEGELVWQNMCGIKEAINIINEM